MSDKERYTLEEMQEFANRWRELALQFDRHRIEALAMLRDVAAGGVTRAEASAFLAAPPPMDVPGPWRCFHCGEVFADEDEARKHFGPSQAEEPVCQITAERYRQVERQLEEYRTESDATARTFFENGAKAQRMATDAEQKGYDRGIGDAKAHPEELDLIDHRTVRVEIESRIHAIVAEHGEYEPDTNVTNLPGTQEAICEELESLLGVLIHKGVTS